MCVSFSCEPEVTQLCLCLFHVNPLSPDVFVSFSREPEVPRCVCVCFIETCGRPKGSCLFIANPR